MFDFESIQRMLELMQEHGLEEFELEHDGLRVRLRKPVGIHRAAGAPLKSDTATGPVQQARILPLESPADEGLVFVKSPIVGTFYRAAEPGAESFVEVGSTVRKGQVLCIIEAMKLMNEIDAEEAGEVVSVFVENGQPVQYGDSLFALKMH